MPEYKFSGMQCRRKTGRATPEPLFVIDETAGPEAGSHLVLESSWLPGTREFCDGVRQLMGRLAERFDVFLMLFPEEGDVRPARNTWSPTRRSFADGRWFSEVRPRARIVQLARNADLVDLAWFDDEGLFLGVDRKAGHNAASVARLLDRAPDRGTGDWVLREVAFYSYALDLKFHIRDRRPEDLDWIRKQLP
ncbi:MAG: hypothetical protein HY815_08955 [Candidatus Riflebacteria bacterium]|nr:hypothetical protein [Candidatus Riflebacteria bacterium]